MRPATPLPLVGLVVLLVLSGCSALGGGRSLTNVEVAGRYRFTTFTIDPESGAVRDYKVLGREVDDDLTLLLDEAGTARLERLDRGEVGDVEARGSYTISGERVTVRLDGGADDFLLPREVTFEGGGQRLKAEVRQEGMNLERISGDYRGITRANATLRIELREIN